MGKSEIILKAEELVENAMKGNDASHDAAHAFRVRDLALSLAREEGFSASPDSTLIVRQSRPHLLQCFQLDYNLVYLLLILYD